MIRARTRLLRFGPFIVADSFARHPRIAWKAFVVRPVVSRAVCSRRGHVIESNLGRLLRCCDRCGTWERTSGEVRP